MAEQDKDLPLVVAEILIEMHGMNDRLQGVDNRLENVENIMLQAVANIQQLSKAVNRTAEVLLQQQQEFNRRFDQRQQESDRRFELLLEADRQQADRLERAIASIENRFERLENN
jgi:flagellar capping protein FliD